MAWGRALTVAGAVFAVLWLALDSAWLSAEPAPAGTSLSLAMLAGVFALGAWVMHAGGQPRRVPLLVGLAIGVGAYALARAIGQ
jgi:hypothetical protein